jgi:hypothetical protein
MKLTLSSAPLVITASLLGACVVDESAPVADDVSATDGTNHATEIAVRPTGRYAIRPATATTDSMAAEPDVAMSTSNGISYHGGPIMLGTTNIHYIWYGNFGAGLQTILTDLASHIGGSPYFNINTTYTNGSGTRVSNSVAFADAVSDNYSHGNSLDDGDIQDIVAQNNPTDTHGVYFVVTAWDVDETQGFCSSYCGWHNHANIGGRDIKYAFIGNGARCPSACEAQPAGPNGTTGADGMASIIAHELEETVTDPHLDAWFDGNGEENADKCAWDFGTEYTAPNGTLANMKIGSRDYLIQRNWVNASGGFCRRSH